LTHRQPYDKITLDDRNRKSKKDMAMVKLKQFVLEKQAREGREILLKEIAEESGISHDTISRLWNDKTTRVDEKTIFGLCKYFGVQPGQPIPFLIYDPD
jgi:DNA-binding Xre family transcriptional regulator